MSGIFARPELVQIADRLFRHYREVPRAVVVRCIETADDDIDGSALDADVAAAVEALARTRLDSFSSKAAGPRRQAADAVEPLGPVADLAGA